jgi:hypothetical protein
MVLAFAGDSTITRFLGDVAVSDFFAMMLSRYWLIGGKEKQTNRPIPNLSLH